MLLYTYIHIRVLYIARIDRLNTSYMLYYVYMTNTLSSRISGKQIDLCRVFIIGIAADLYIYNMCVCVCECVCWYIYDRWYVKVYTERFPGGDAIETSRTLNRA